ncbi:MAG TPA: YHS domain-containing protein [Caldithrix abyssi]|uniref:YHS domain-containing protein n=1 Tax=Caldithrix abyssi TaxID=187145 RepID=A0A7V4U1Y5_CALAY|nr:YHS domain-containing protein [Caldithrix abyssi]
MSKKHLVKDPVCGRRMSKNKAFITIQHRGEQYYLCCPKCQSEFEKAPEKYIQHQK